MQSIRISHRDIKPENLVLDSNKKKIFIIDFGISEKVKGPFENKDITEWTIKGTPEYFSPEIIDAKAHGKVSLCYDLFKSDVFSFGLVILELLTLDSQKNFESTNDLEQYINKNFDSVVKTKFQIKAKNRKQNFEQKQKEEFDKKQKTETQLKVAKEKFELKERKNNQMIDDLLNLIKDCLKIEPKHRPDFVDLFLKLKKKDNRKNKQE